MTIPSTASPVILVGNPDVVHVGAHLSAAAGDLGYRVTHLNSEDAFAGPRWVRTINWRVRGHRPARLRAFSERVVDTCRQRQPQWLLATGIAPIDESALKAIGRLGTRRLNYLTDDPWNPSHRAQWFMRALRHYDWIFSARRSNLADLRRHGCNQVSYLPFAYAPGLHYGDPPRTEDADRRLFADVVFAGGADPDRVPVMAALIRHGFTVALYGGYWDRYAETRQVARGLADPQTLRRAVGGAKVALCLVRRANRDDNSMRTFEVAAMGACMLAEYTDAHREILGEDGDAVAYFRSPSEMLDRLRWLLEHEDERRRMGAAIQSRITGGRNTYQDRLATMLAVAAPAS